MERAFYFLTFFIRPKSRRRIQFRVTERRPRLAIAHNHEFRYATFAAPRMSRLPGEHIFCAALEYAPLPPVRLRALSPHARHHSRIKIAAWFDHCAVVARLGRLLIMTLVERGRTTMRIPEQYLTI
jgi:hypothetical protein